LALQEYHDGEGVSGVPWSPGQDRGPDVEIEAIFAHETTDRIASRGLGTRGTKGIGQIGSLNKEEKLYFYRNLGLRRTVKACSKAF
jgi:hypothetical protein